MTEPAELLVIGGRSGVGKSSVAFEVSAQLAASNVAHALIEGDFLDLAFPPPSDDRLAEKNLATMWANYQDGGYTRLIYTNTLSVLFADRIVAAMRGPVHVTSVLLTCTDKTARERLALREIGSTLAEHIDRSKQAYLRLKESAPDAVVTVDTDGLSVTGIALQVIALTGWTR